MNVLQAFHYFKFHCKRFLQEVAVIPLPRSHLKTSIYSRRTFHNNKYWFSVQKMSVIDATYQFRCDSVGARCTASICQNFRPVGFKGSTWPEPPQHPHSTTTAKFSHSTFFTVTLGILLLLINRTFGQITDQMQFITTLGILVQLNTFIAFYCFDTNHDVSLTMCLCLNLTILTQTMGWMILHNR